MDRVHTYSIVARDPETGQFGVGVQSHYFASGAVVPWAERDVGAVATQAEARRDYGPKGLVLMREGKTAEQALQRTLRTDEGRELRQVAMVDREGRAAAHTGSKCIEYAGAATGENYSAQGNLLGVPDTWKRMAEAFEKTEGSLSERIMQALEAGEDAGGDVRGKQSAGMLVVPGPDDPLERDWIINVRVDDHSHPLIELRRLLTVQRCYAWGSRAEHALKRGELDEAKGYYEKMRGSVVGTREPHFWYAASLAEHGHIRDSMEVLKEVIHIEPVWKQIIDRLVSSGSFPNDRELIMWIKAQ